MWWREISRMKMELSILSLRSSRSRVDTKYCKSLLLYFAAKDCRWICMYNLSYYNRLRLRLAAHETMPGGETTSMRSAYLRLRTWWWWRLAWDFFSIIAAALCVPLSVFDDDVHIGKWIVRFYTICSFHLSSSLSLSLHSCCFAINDECAISRISAESSILNDTLALVNWTKCRARVVEILEF